MRLSVITAVALALISLSAGCGDNKSPASQGDSIGGDSDPNPGDNAPLPFGSFCDANEDCQSDFCATFGNGVSACTIMCGTDGDCPSGTQGQKCNGRGFCAY